MANNILKTLTIDGTSVDIHAPERKINVKTINIVNTKEHVGATLTLDKKGVYWIKGAITFPSATSTGARYTACGVGTDIYGNLSYDGQQQPNGATTVELSSEAVFVIDTVPCNVYVWGRSSLVTNNCSTAIQFVRIEDL